MFFVERKLWPRFGRWADGRQTLEKENRKGETKEKKETKEEEEHLQEKGHAERQRRATRQKTCGDDRLMTVHRLFLWVAPYSIAGDAHLEEREAQRK